jgi:hypothetical protein
LRLAAQPRNSPSRPFALEPAASSANRSFQVPARHARPRHQPSAPILTIQDSGLRVSTRSSVSSESARAARSAGIRRYGSCLGHDILCGPWSNLATRCWRERIGGSSPCQRSVAVRIRPWNLSRHHLLAWTGTSTTGECGCACFLLRSSSQGCHFSSSWLRFVARLDTTLG